MGRIILICGLLAVRCAPVSPSRDVELESAMSRAQPMVQVSPPPLVSVVNWESFVWNEDDPNVSFNLYYGYIFPHEYDHAITGITNLECAVSNMVPGTTYYLAVSSVDTNGAESDLSPEYVYEMPTTLEMGFSFGDTVTTNITVQSSTNLITWEVSNARLRTNGLWRVDVDSPAKFFRGVSQIQ